MCLDNDRCTQVQYAGKSMVYVSTETIIHLITLLYESNWNSTAYLKKGRRGIQVYFPITFNSNAFNFLRLFVSGSDMR